MPLPTNPFDSNDSSDEFESLSPDELIRRAKTDPELEKAAKDKGYSEAFPLTMEEISLKETLGMTVKTELPEGKFQSSVHQPEDWENEGSSFDVHRGKREALIESVYSTELDEDRGDGIKTGNTKLALYGIGLITFLALIGFVLTSLNQTKAPTEVIKSDDPFVNFVVKHTDPLAKKFPSETNPSQNLYTSIKGKSVTINGNKLTFSKEKVLKNGDDCIRSYSTVEDLCFVGSTSPTGLELYYSLDMVHSPRFSETSDIFPTKKTIGKESLSTVVLYLGKPERFLFVVNEDNSGWALRLPREFTPENVDSLVTTLAVKSNN